MAKMHIRQAVLQLQVVAKMGSDRGGMEASDQGGNGDFRPAMMVASDRQRCSLQTRCDGNGLIYEGSVRVREFDLKKKERENTGWRETNCEKREKNLNKKKI